MVDESKRAPGADLDGAPESAVSSDDRDEFLHRCETERDTMTPKETSDCAGAELADSYENEEDGGS